MANLSKKRTGIVIIVLGAIMAAFAALGHVQVPIAAGIAVIAILIGNAVARGKFSRPPDAGKRE
jgi:hypothetical protein